jgi:hypothetical protein
MEREQVQRPERNGRQQNLVAIAARREPDIGRGHQSEVDNETSRDDPRRGCGPSSRGQEAVADEGRGEEQRHETELDRGARNVGARERDLGEGEA